jgi:enterochelin esterase-like enzyme
MGEIMKNKLFLVLVILLVFGTTLLFGQAQPVPYGQVLESLSFTSEILGNDVFYSIYLPPDYEISKRSYPVVYLLHGGGGNETHWVQMCEANVTADRLIAERKIPAMILVMPAAGRTRYINDFKGESRYEDMFIQELMPHIDKNYRTRRGQGEFTDKKFRAVSGFSMGGYGSLMLTLHHTDKFIACVAYSASGLWDDERILSMSEEAYGRRYANLYGTPRLNEHYRNNSPLHLAKTMSEEELKSVFWYIDCGDDDGLSIGNTRLHKIFKEREILHEFRIRDGHHYWEYWKNHLDKGLIYIGKAFLHDD